MISPRQFFSANADQRKKWSEISESGLFEAACQAALAQMIVDMPTSPDSAIGTAFKMMGARDFIRSLSTLCEVEVKRKVPLSQNLEHQH
jgi:hypothetical protein